jgi:hypothetical protein
MQKKETFAEISFFIRLANSKACILIMRTALILLVASGVSYAAPAKQIEIQSIQILPAKVTVGTHPEITGSIKAHAVKPPAASMEINVIASVVRPDHVMKSWTWKNVRMRAGEIRTFTVPKQYDVKASGTYKVDFNVYTRDMRPLHRVSKTFVATDSTQPPVKATVPEKADAIAGVPPPRQAAGSPTAGRHIGLGLYANTLNGSGGASMLLWPFKYVGLQASYTAGVNTITEGRLLARFPLSSGINPYLGVGYVSVETERNVEVIDIKTTFRDSGISGAIGVEIPIRKSLTGYLELSGASIDLKKEVTNGTISGIATVDYAPVTIGIGIVYFLF